MKFSELRKKPKEELQKILEDDREKLRQLRFDLSAGKVKNVREIRNIKNRLSIDAPIPNGPRQPTPVTHGRPLSASL